MEKKHMKSRNILVGIAFLAIGGIALAQEFDLKQGEVVVPAFSQGNGNHVLLMLPGAAANSRSNRDGLKNTAIEIAKGNDGIKAISISWQGHGDVAAAVQFAKENGAKKISLLGFSAGAEMAGRFASSQPDGEFDTIVLLGSIDDQGIPLKKTKKLFIHSNGDSIGRWTVKSFEQSADPKEILILERSGHSLRDFKAERPSLIADIAAALKR